MSSSNAADSIAVSNPNNTTSHATRFARVSDDPAQRGAVTDRFQTEYRDVLEAVGDEYKAVTHWAKQELPPEGAPDRHRRLEKIRERLAEVYPVKDFKAMQRLFDPENRCGNELIEQLL